MHRTLRLLAASDEKQYLEATSDEIDRLVSELRRCLAVSIDLPYDATGDPQTALDELGADGSNSAPVKAEPVAVGGTASSVVPVARQVYSPSAEEQQVGIQFPECGEEVAFVEQLDEIQ